MNTGIFGEGFPYSNFHNLNMDWIIKIAKDFLDQYTHIQEIIEQGETDIQNLTTSGLEQLQDKADALEALLQQWYDTHSADIADQLTDALADLNSWYTTHQNYLDQTLIDKENAFDAHADQKAQQTIATIPDDYTALYNTVVKQGRDINAKVYSTTDVDPTLTDNLDYTDNYYISASGVVTALNGMMYSDPLVLPEGKYWVTVIGTQNDNSTTRVHGYNSSDTWLKQIASSQLDANYGKAHFLIDTKGCYQIRFSSRMGYIITLARFMDEPYIKCLATTGSPSNYMDGVTYTEGKFISESGVLSDNASMEISSRFAVPYGEYVLTVIGTTNDNTITRVHGYTADGTWIKQLGWSLLTEKYGYCQIKINTYQCPYICISSRIGYIFTLSKANNTVDDIISTAYNELPEIFEFGAISPISGQDIASPSTNNRARVSGYIDSAVNLIKSDSIRYWVSLYIYNRDNTYLGVWNGNGIEIPAQNVPAFWTTEINIDKVRETLSATYPNFLMRIAVRRSDDQAFTIEYASTIKLYSFNKDILVATVSLFENWAVCGASYDAGNFNDGTAEYNVDHINLSWVQILARRTGTTAKNYAVGGWTTRSFIDSTGNKGLAQALADDPKDLYVLTFGGNDASLLSIGTIADITNYNDWHNYPNTFYGNYGQIIERLMAHAPHAKFILTTPPSPWYTSNQLTVDNAVREIAYHYLIPVIEWESDPFMRSDFFIKGMINAHPTPIGYSGMALAFERLFSKCVKNNFSYFNQWNLT